MLIVYHSNIRAKKNNSLNDFQHTTLFTYVLSVIHFKDLKTFKKIFYFTQ